jgi:hypothetical protein
LRMTVFTSFELCRRDLEHRMMREKNRAAGASRKNMRVALIPVNPRHNYAMR